MVCCVTDLRDKEVINLKDGNRLGTVSDVEIDTCTGKIVAIIIYGKGHFFCGKNKNNDIKICWEDIEVIGDETILVRFDCPNACTPQKCKYSLDTLFRQG